MEQELAAHTHNNVVERGKRIEKTDILTRHGADPKKSAHTVDAQARRDRRLEQIVKYALHWRDS